ncbi:phosphopantetheine-binding protein [Puniceibacterium sediminis]|uniref:Aryl carrier domain-containing protein n=1 Tax=Puniceibacterium sediminis TaxID=1608407 RepID=A0A238ZGP4_9RHOB|nr:phosphopantetheine-binding protein [Puniceibacterium sediminis]SNR82507.1 Aryl carrier domain-containing protein [Puniceibacterium sediminis]
MDANYAMLRAEVAKLLHISPEEVDADENLTDLGIDSMRLMTLFLALDTQGLAVEYSMFLERPTMNGIWEATGQPPQSDTE